MNTIEPEPASRRRPSVEEKIRDYWHPCGNRYQAGLAEARALLEVGAPLEEAAAWLGWTIPMLLKALPQAFSKIPGTETAA